MTTIPTDVSATLELALHAGLRWLYATEQPSEALVERSGAKITTAERVLRFVPLSVGGNPLIVVDLLTVHWGLGELSPPLNALPADELPTFASELAELGIPTSALHYHGITGTITLDVPAHPSLQEAVRRYDRGCPWHHTHVCDAPVRDGGKGCPWHADGHHRAIWPTITAAHGHASAVVESGSTAVTCQTLPRRSEIPRHTI